MAVSSPGWLFSAVSCTKATQNLSSLTSSASESCYFLSTPHRKRWRSTILISNSSGCSSPILEEETPTDQPLSALEFQFQDFRILSMPPESEVSNKIPSLTSGNEDLVLENYEKAKRNPEFRPENSTIRILIGYLCRSRNWSIISSICDDLKKFKVVPDSATCCKLVSLSIRDRKFKIANNLLNVVETNRETACLVFDSAMKGYNKLHMYSSTIALHERMKFAEISLNPGCYYWIMEANLKVGNADKVPAIFLDLKNRGFGLTIHDKDIHQVLFKSLDELGRPYEALEIFREMVKKGIKEDHSIYSTLICSFAKIRELKVAETLFREAEEKKMLRDPALFLKLILAYIEEGTLEKTIEIVSIMKNIKIKPSDCILCSIVNGFSKKKGLKAAIKVYDDLILQGHKPGQVTYASIMNVYYRLGLYLKAEQIFHEMENEGFDKCVVAYSNMISIYGKLNRVREAMKLVAKMKEKRCEPNIWVYNSLLDMQGRAMNLSRVEKIWKEMTRKKITPDKISYTSIIGAYNKGREFEKCIKYYNEFRVNGGAIDRAMAGIMVGVFSKMSRIDELVKLLQDMKAEGTRLDSRLHKSALNAFRDAGMHAQVKWLLESYVSS